MAPFWAKHDLMVFGSGGWRGGGGVERHRWLLDLMVSCLNWSAPVYPGTWLDKCRKDSLTDKRKISKVSDMPHIFFFKNMIHCKKKYKNMPQVFCFLSTFSCVSRSYQCRPLNIFLCASFCTCPCTHGISIPLSQSQPTNMSTEIPQHLLSKLLLSCPIPASSLLTTQMGLAP